MAKIVFIIIYLLIQNFELLAQEDVNITPRPLHMQVTPDSFLLSAATRLVVQDPALKNAADFFSDYLQNFYGIQITPDYSSITNIPGTNTIVLGTKTAQGEVGYHLAVEHKKIEVSSKSDTGVFYGIQTLIQLLPLPAGKKEMVIQGIEINDRPRFSYRGIHLDVARHFYGTSYLKRFIDLLALHKFNKFHWHLTDDQGWRMEVMKYPLLTVTGSCREQTLRGRFGSNVYDSTPHFGFYSRREMKDIVDYAARRYITVIPEIDMPGHTTAALASYPFLGCTKGPYKVSQTWGVHKEVMCAGNDSTYLFINDVLQEVAQIFPSELIHIGGDEVPKERWASCPVCQARMKKEGLKNEAELQSYFIGRVNKIVERLGRTMVGWDEILEGKDVPGTVIMNWRGRKYAEEAFRLGHPVIFTPDNPLYLNFKQSINEDSITQGGYNPIEQVYAYDPVNEKTPLVLVKGIQANLWTEYISNKSKLEYMLLPRLAAVAEAAWTSTEKKNFSDFEKRLPLIQRRYTLWGFNYSNAHFGLQHETIPLPSGGIGWKLFSRQGGKIFYTREGKAEKLYSHTIPILETQTVSARLEDSAGAPIGGTVSLHFDVNKCTGKKITLENQPNSMYAGKGGFTLVDGIQNSAGMVKSAQFLGFIGNDLVATIDLGAVQQVESISLHAFEQKESWIYSPGKVSFYLSTDGRNFRPVAKEVLRNGKKNLVFKIDVKQQARYIKVSAINHGLIPAGSSGAGRRSWLFVDEIVVK